MKITITTTKKESKEIELPEFPFYLKGKDCAFKMEDANKCISITDFHFIVIQGNYPSEIPLGKFEDWGIEISTRQEFLDFYDATLKKIVTDL